MPAAPQPPAPRPHQTTGHPPPAPAGWFVLHSKPKAEHLAAAALNHLPGVQAYCPRIKFQRNTRRGQVWFIEALFPGYFFAHFDPALSLRAVRAAKGVLRVVEFGGHLPSVPPETIAAIQAEMDHQPIKELPSNLEVGQWVEITQGAMRGLKGWIAHIRDGHLGSAQHRVHLLMEFLGRENLVQIPSTQILPETNPRTTL